MDISVSDIHKSIQENQAWGNVVIPEFTWGSLRIDLAVVDMSHKYIKGFEIKISRADFLRDTKWVEYAQFCSTLSVACPEGLIKKEEIESPFGLIYILSKKNWRGIHENEWIKRPRSFNSRRSLSWLFNYTAVLEKELPRLDDENKRLKVHIENLTKALTKTEEQSS